MFCLQARKAQLELDEKVESVKAGLRATQAATDSFGGGAGLDCDARMEFDDNEKMRKPGARKARHVGPGGKHSARM